jgi:hypothetical protein
MNHFEDKIRRYSGRRTVGGHFEERVFAKIRRKKKVRRIGYSAFTFILVVSILVSVLVFLPGGGTDSRMSDRLAQGSEYRSGTLQVKEDVPVMEDLYFAPYDGRTNYAIHQVSLTEDDGGI